MRYRKTFTEAFKEVWSKAIKEQEDPDRDPSARGALREGKLDYTITITDTDGAVISKGIKAAKEDSINWEN